MSMKKISSWIFSLLLLPTLCFAQPKLDFNVEVINLPAEFDYAIESQWLAIGDRLISSPNQIITLVVDGVGGNLSMVHRFIRDMKEAQSQGKIIQMRVRGDALSGHAYILCSATVVVLEPGAHVMYHKGSSYGGISIPYLNMNIPIQGDIASRENLIRLQLMLDDCVSHGRLSEQQAKDILNNKEVNFYVDDKKITTQTIDEEPKYLITLQVVATYLFALFSLIVLIGLIKRI